jgi:peptide/nickel transport system substrate-binding protein
LSLISLVALVAPGAAAQDAEDQVVLTIGLIQPWTTLNVTSGFTVSEYEYWNLQYATLTDKAADDFATIPGLAESWVENEPGLSYTYTLREGLEWSDGTPLTADDIAWNVNTGRDQGWDTPLATVQNLTAEVVDDRTITITSAVPDPKLPTMDVYILPRHIWESQAPDYETVITYDARDGVGSGPFVLEEYVEEQSITLAANPSHWRWQGEDPAIDKVVFRVFTNPDAMVAALKQGEIDAAHDISAASLADLEATENIEVVAGAQGGFDEIAVNGGAAAGQPHPALLDINVRRAIGHGIDKQAVIEDIWFGTATEVEAISTGADLKWIPEIPEEDRIGFDPDAARALLDEGGYLDTNDDGFREMPGGGDNIVIRHAVNTDSDTSGPIGDLFAGWMREIGLQVELESYDQDRLFQVIIDGTYDTFHWGWTPFVDPDPMLSYFTSSEIGNYNDANWSSPDYDALYEQQNQELDPDRRLDLVHQAVTVLHDAAVYFPLYVAPDLQAYRTDRFEGWVRQPAEVGPVMFSNTSPSYVLLRPLEGGGGAGGLSPIVLAAIGVGAVAVIAFLLISARRRQASEDERE